MKRLASAFLAVTSDSTKSASLFTCSSLRVFSTCSFIFSNHKSILLCSLSLKALLTFFISCHSPFFLFLYVLFFIHFFTARCTAKKYSGFSYLPNSFVMSSFFDLISLHLLDQSCSDKVFLKTCKRFKSLSNSFIIEVHFTRSLLTEVTFILVKGNLLSCCSVI
uniref:Uncharacterized protein n=1 Tax=Panstrongylus lignarius TaxID=156445 RepID=A0A224XMG5_9HEMI